MTYASILNGRFLQKTVVTYTVHFTDTRGGIDDWMLADYALLYRPGHSPFFFQKLICDQLHHGYRFILIIISCVPK
jgi:hypothetical protein